MIIPLTEAALRVAMTAIGNSLVGGAIELFADEDLAGEDPLARVPITEARFVGGDELILETAATTGVSRGRAGWFRCAAADGSQFVAGKAGKTGSGAALELNRLGVDLGAPVRLTLISLRWPQPLS
jgi:hypothetical protein